MMAVEIVVDSCSSLFYNVRISFNGINEHARSGRSHPFLQILQVCVSDQEQSSHDASNKTQATLESTFNLGEQHLLWCRQQQNIFFNLAVITILYVCSAILLNFSTNNTCVSRNNLCLRSNMFLCLYGDFSTLSPKFSSEYNKICNNSKYVIQFLSC